MDGTDRLSRSHLFRKTMSVVFLSRVDDTMARHRSRVSSSLLTDGSSASRSSKHEMAGVTTQDQTSLSRFDMVVLTRN
jgi:hypothetical protein